MEMFVASSEGFQSSASEGRWKAQVQWWPTGTRCVYWALGTLWMREEIAHAQNPPRMQNWEDLRIPERSERLEKSCRKHKGPVWKTQSKSIWRGIGDGRSASRMLLWGAAPLLGEVPARVLPSARQEEQPLKLTQCCLSPWCLVPQSPSVTSGRSASPKMQNPHVGNAFPVAGMVLGGFWGCLLHIHPFRHLLGEAGRWEHGALLQHAG